MKTPRKTFVENLQDGRASIERAVEILTDARSSFWLAAEESKIAANQIYLENLVDLLSRELTRLDFEKTSLPDTPRNRVIEDCLVFMCDDDYKRETDYRIVEEPTMETEVAKR